MSLTSYRAAPPRVTMPRGVCLIQPTAEQRAQEQGRANPRTAVPAGEFGPVGGSEGVERHRPYNSFFALLNPPQLRCRLGFDGSRGAADAHNRQVASGQRIGSRRAMFRWTATAKL